MAKERVVVGSRGKKIVAITAAGVLAVAGAGIGLGVGLSGGGTDGPQKQENTMIWGVNAPTVSGSGKVDVVNDAEEYKTTVDFSGLSLNEYVEFDINLDNMTEDDYVYSINLDYDPSQVKIEIVAENGEIVDLIGDTTPFIFSGDREEGGVKIKITSLEDGATGTVGVDLELTPADENPVEMFVVNNQGEMDQVLGLDSAYPIVATIKEGTYNLAGVDGNAVISKNVVLKAENGADVRFGNINVADNVKLEVSGAVVEGNIKILSSAAQVVLNNTTATNGLLTLEDVTITGEIEAVEATQDKSAYNVPTIYIAENVNARIQILGDVEINAPEGAAGIGVEETASVEIFGEGKDAEASLIIYSNGMNEAKTAHGTSAIGSIYKTTGKGSYPTGKISIHDLNGLEAYAYGLGAAGIGGSMGENSLDITNVHIVDVRGGLHNEPYQSAYGNSDPEGGPAIGFAWSKSTTQTVNLTNVTIDYIKGGCKSAAIGGNCWNTKIAINIVDCDIKELLGGGSAAGIGAGRPASNTGDDSSVYIKIHNSTVVAQGGTRGAAIGGGYSDNCMRVDREISNTPIAPEVDIVITGNSTITAVGGDHAAAIGTGYHGSRVSGRIDSTVTLLNCVAGKVSSKYFDPQVVGLGQLDHVRDGSLIVDGLVAFDTATRTLSNNTNVASVVSAYNQWNTKITYTEGMTMQDFLDLTVNAGKTAGDEGYVVYDPSVSYVVESKLVNNGQIVNE